jgi:hypothetical protein
MKKKTFVSLISKANASEPFYSSHDFFTCKVIS